MVDHAGFGAAAQALDVAQSSVSAHIQALERKAGTALFRRVAGRSPQLTEAGRTLYSYAQDMLERARSVEMALGRSSGCLRFAAQRSVAASLLRRPLEAFAAECQTIELVARTGTFEEVLALYKSGDVDVAFVLTDGEVPGVEMRPLGRYRLAFVALPSHPLAGRSQIPPHELEHHAFVGPPPTSHFGRMVARLLQRAGAPRLSIRSRGEEISVLREMMLAGMGIGLVIRRSVQKDLARGALVELDVDVDPIYLRLCYAQNPNAAMPQIGRLAELIQASEAQVL